MCAQAREEKLRRAEQTSALPKIVIPTHFAGLPCDMAAIRGLGERYGFSVIEDAAHAIGARIGDARTGDCAFSDITIFSFHPVKIITTGEGGMATSNDESLARKMQLLRSHGITREANELESPSEGGWHYEQQLLGFNYRMTDMQAALGLSQLSNIEAWILRRHEIADVYDSALSDLPLILPKRLAQSQSRTALHLYVVEIDDLRTSLDRKTVFERLRELGVGVNVHYIPVHTQPYYRNLGFFRGAFPNSERYYSRCLSLPMHAGLTNEQQLEVMRAMRAVLS